MEQIDQALERFRSLARQISGYSETIVSESDTRLKVVDPVLTEVLLWPLAEIATEPLAGSGFIDYKLTIGGFARFILEAKKDGRSLGINLRSSGRPYKLSGAVFHAEAVAEGIEQAIKYCGRMNAELACVTNGHEWVVFRGSRLGDGRDTTDGMAFVFPSLSAVEEDFARFYDLISRESVAAFRYRALFQEAEGRPIRAQLFKKSVHAPESRRLIEHGNLSGDLERVMTSFFRRLSGDDDPDLLARCFVATRESELADQQLARISEDLVGRIRSIRTSEAEELTRLIEKVKATQRNEFVLIVGTKGAGKSTFIDRFFAHVLPKPLMSDCIVAKVNLADGPGDEDKIVDWLDQALLAVLEEEIFQQREPDFEEIQGMFFDEYRRMSKGTLRPLYDRDKGQFQIEFGRHVERRREERPHDYICRLLAHVVRVRKKVPCVVLDNADHFTITFQERVFQYARSVYERELCMVIMPITDRTSWQLSREGALRSFETESLFLPTPSPKAILQRRVDFLEAKLAEERREPGRGYFVGRGIPLSIDNLTAFTAALQGIFLKTGQVAWWIGNLANRDVRRCLEMAKSIVTSPHIEVGELVKSYVIGTSIHIPRFRVLRAIIRGRYDIYPQGDHPYVRNIFCMDDHFETTPLLGVRILQLLRDVQKAEVDDPFITLEQVIDYFRAMLLDPSVLMFWLGQMLETGLCLSYDPTVTSITEVKRIELSPAGFQHLRWATRETNYLQAMLQVTPLTDSAVHDRLCALAKGTRAVTWKEELECFVHYLVTEDAKHCCPQAHEAYTSQRQIAIELTKLIPN